MKITDFIIFWLISQVMSLAMQDDGGDNTSSAKPTSVWITTTIGGSLLTVQTTYQQSFISTYTEANTEDVQQGSVGMGSLSGGESIGNMRSYSQTTISSQGGAAPQWLGSSSSIYTGLLGGVVVLLGCI